ncbi:hypothetical protein [Haliovirga abyssi]|uniref:Flagellar protein n=1 Tax=Haliovirga abyssi TaxID=2996794 RepID=A0AAU9DCN3_9FUSO|nr:hypothetical protein [Haliovirga abyssi]BDU51085.1 hypothetical protein HLVA_16540 [Haliovirga abyssi]
MGFDNLVECKICGKLFMKTGRKNICPSCLNKEEELFMEVKNYLYDSPNASIKEVAEQTEIDEGLIMDWVREGRLERTGIIMTYPCEMCGKPIHTGKICKSCQNELGVVSDSLSGTKDEGKDETKRSMYISDKFKK